MEKIKRNILSITIVSVVLVFVANISLGTFLVQSKRENSKEQIGSQESLIPTARVTSDTFSYQGEEGRDAYELLIEKATIKEDNSGLITAINGREAVREKREFWAFYVNGQQASVGPKTYITSNEDVIEWRIEKY